MDRVDEHDDIRPSLRKSVRRAWRRLDPLTRDMIVASVAFTVVAFVAYVQGYVEGRKDR